MPPSLIKQQTPNVLNSEFSLDACVEEHHGVVLRENPDQFQDGFVKEAKNYKELETPGSVGMDERIVCFIDLLGTSKMMKMISEDESKKSDDVPKITPKEAYDMVNKILKCFKKCVDELKRWNDDTASMVISDSYVVSVPALESDAFTNLTQQMSIFQKFCLIECGQATRGGIARGKMVSKEGVDNLIIGEALIFAHELEARIADYPRVIFSADLADEIKKLSEKKIFSKYFGKDKDCLWYISYLQNATEEEIEKARKNVQDQLSKLDVRKDQRERQKWYWLETYLTQIQRGTALCCVSSED